MKKNIKYILIGLLLIPTVVLAEVSEETIILMSALGMEAFISIHMSLFVLLPLSKILKPDDSKNFFWRLFIIRIIVLLIFDFLITPFIAIVDFFAVFVGAFIIIPKLAKNSESINSVLTGTEKEMINNSIVNNSISINCTKCGGVLQVTDKFCPNCGTPFEGNNVTITAKKSENYVKPEFDKMFNYPEDKMLEFYINKKLVELGVDSNSNYIPESSLKRKRILNIIFSVLLFVFVSLIFFHFPPYTYIIGLIILVVYYFVTRKYDLIDYLKKEIKSRPSEKMVNIIMNAKNSFVVDNSGVIKIVGVIAALILPLIIFMNPRIMYEKVEGGYAVRFYTFGLTNFKTATIPETYKGEKVISLRGNTFSNMYFLTTVKLPDSIVEIRGQAFKNDASLVDVNIPKYLKYLGGGAFYNCISLKSVVLPDTLTEMGGETFYNASSLEEVKLSSNLTEIRGDTFENCTSLKSISIPDKVTRIGGHAFYGDSSLSEVYISPNSALKEIGSSAFRQCSSLQNITIPANTYVNERAFKESPTVVNKYGEENIDPGYDYGDYGDYGDYDNYDDYYNYDNEYSYNDEASNRLKKLFGNVVFK